MESGKAEPRLPFRLSVCGKAALHKFADSCVTHLISIDNPPSPTQTPEWFSGIHWHIVFQDVETPAEAREFNAVPPTRQDVEKILDCGRSCLQASKAQDVHLLLHCMAGASRSTAAGFAILCLVLGEGREPESLSLLLSIKPDAFPNMLVVKYADELLDRKGRMLEVLRLFREESSRQVDGWDEGMKRTKKGVLTYQEEKPFLLLCAEQLAYYLKDTLRKWNA